MACNGSGNAENCPNAESFEVVDATGLAGCVWVLKDAKNESFEPTNLLDLKPDVKNGDRINAELKIETQLASICQMGQIVTITCIE